MKLITCRRVLRMIYLGSGLNKSGLVHQGLWGSWGANPGRGMAGGRGICTHFHFHPQRNWVGRRNLSARSVHPLGGKQKRHWRHWEKQQSSFWMLPQFGELGHKWDQSFGSYCRCHTRLMDFPDDGEPLPTRVSAAPVAWRPRGPWPLASWPLVRSAVF